MSGPTVSPSAPSGRVAKQEWGLQDATPATTALQEALTPQKMVCGTRRDNTPWFQFLMAVQSSDKIFRRPCRSQQRFGL